MVYLTKGDYQVQKNIWQLCFEICFHNFNPQKTVTIDKLLIDDDGEVNWQQLEIKTKKQVKTLFALS